MSHFLLFKMVFLKSKQPTAILILVVKISITDLSNSAWLTSRRRLVSASKVMLVPPVVSELSAKRQSVFFHLPIKPKLSAKLLRMVRTSHAAFHVPSSRSSALTYSASVCPQLNKSLRMLTLVKVKFTKSSLSVVQPVFPKSKPCFQTFSMERLSTDLSTLMKPSPTVPLYRLQFSMEKVQNKLETSFYSTSHPFLKVLRLLEVSCQFLFLATLPFQPRKLKLSPHTPTTNPEC